MSNRTRLNGDIYSRNAHDRQVLSSARREQERRITGGVGQRSNAFRLSDIHKLVIGRHGGQCDDHVWMRRYFRAALPHVLSDAGRIRAAGGSDVEAVLEWVREHVPLMLIDPGEGWIDTETEKCRAKGRRRCPRVDRTSLLLQIEDHEPKAFGLCSLPAMSRPLHIRKAEDGARRVQAERDRRAQKPGYVPRSESKAARLRAEGKNPHTEKSRERRERLEAEKVDEALTRAAEEAARIDREEGPDSDAWWNVQIAKAKVATMLREIGVTT